MTAAYATVADLLSFTASGTLDDLDDPERQLTRASELLDATVRTPFTVDADTDLPTDTDVAAAMRDACCAQVEFWAETGEEHDVDGLAGTTYSVTGYSGSRPTELAPRAYRILHTAGLLGILTAAERAALIEAGAL